MPRRARSRAVTRSLDALLVPAREPDFRQQRSRRSYLALIDAATELFGAHGYDAVGTPEIAQRAGVSVGTFYRYFDDKHEVYLEVMRRTIGEAYTQTLDRLTPERFAGRARHDTIADAVATLFQHVLRRPQLTRSYMEMSLRDDDVGELRRAFEERARAQLAELIGAIASRDAVPDPAAVAYVLYGCAMQCAYGLAIHLGPAPLERERARKALALVIERVLFAAAG